MHPLDLVGVDVGGSHFNRGWQVDDHLPVMRGLPNIVHGVDDLNGIVKFRAREGFRRILKEHIGVARDLISVLLHQARTLQGDVLDRFLVGVKNHAALQGRRRVIYVHDRT